MLKKILEYFGWSIALKKSLLENFVNKELSLKFQVFLRLKFNGTSADFFITS